MSSRNINGLRYLSTSDPVQGSFGVDSSFNIAVAAIAVDSAPINSEAIIVCATDYVRWDINQTATATSPIIPPGYTALLWNRNEFISFLQLNNPSEVTVYIPRG